MMNVKSAIRNIRNDPISLLVMFNRARGHVGILSFIMIAWMFIYDEVENGCIES